MPWSACSVIPYFLYLKEKLEANNTKCQFCMVGRLEYAILFLCLQFFKLIDYFLEKLQVQRKLSKNYRLPCFFLSNSHNFPIIYFLHYCDIFVTIGEPIDTFLLTEVHHLHQGSLCVLQFFAFDKCIMSCIYHYSSIQNVPQKPPLFHLLIPFFLPRALGNH